MNVTPGTNPNPKPPVQRPPQSAAARWLQRYHARINAGGGLLLLALAVLIPIIAPVEQRGQVLIMTILFGLVGALMLYMAVNAGTRSSTATSQARAIRRSTPGSASRAVLRARQTRQGQLRAWLGLLFGAAFIVAGIVAPFALAEGEANPDARFLMVIGFSPIVVSGALMAWLFARMLRAGAASGDVSQTAERSAAPASPAARSSSVSGDSLASTLATVGVISGSVLAACAALLPFVATQVMRPNVAGASALMGTVGMLLTLVGGLVLRRQQHPDAPQAVAPGARRAPVQRIPATALYRVVVPVAIALLVVLIALVILVVAAATVTPLVR
jgi:hypothetical protein